LNKNINRENKLALEQSPYLLQHKNNPVDWYPWGEETFEMAKSQNKPVFLSIGYSTCHWCHVMEHESFSDAEVAAMMNDTFINIKVDREERPDIDHIYMTVCQIMNGSGGWPMTILMTPDKKPFFAGTYFTKESSEQRVGIKDIIKRTKEIWVKHNKELNESADEIIQQISMFREPGNLTDYNDSLIKKCFYELASSFEDDFGGFSKKPKFPIPHNIMFLFRFWKQTDNKDALNMALHTLRNMRSGGIYDHTGFGFHRYSTDKEWLVPHFEKMLYDQALLSIAYTEAYQITKDKEFKRTVEEILEYVNRDMTNESGGFYSAEDADSEGVEGKFYFWEIDEIRKVLIGDVDFFCDVFNIKEKGNFKDEILGDYTGKNILHLNKKIHDLSIKYGQSEEEILARINKNRQKLFDYREKRIHPYKDDKILTDWNGMMISALAIAGKALNNNQYILTAERAVSFIKSNMIKNDGRLYHRYRAGNAGIDGMIDDYAYTIWGLIELYSATFKNEYLNLAKSLIGVILEDFYDNKDGGFYFTSIFAEKLIARKKEIYDGAVPSGNSVMLLNLLKLWKLTADEQYKKYVENCLKCFAVSLANVPSAYTFFVAAVQFYTNESSEHVIASESREDCISAAMSIYSEFLPENVISAKYPGSENIADFTADMNSSEGKTNFYLCKDYSCMAPETDVEIVLKNMRVKII
jgi:hypothetical protein